MKGPFLILRPLPKEIYLHPWLISHPSLDGFHAGVSSLDTFLEHLWSSQALLKANIQSLNCRGLVLLLFMCHPVCPILGNLTFIPLLTKDRDLGVILDTLLFHYTFPFSPVIFMSKYSDSLHFITLPLTF